MQRFRSHRSKRREHRPAPRDLRSTLALAVFVLFAFVFLATMVVPSAGALNQALIVVGSLLTIVLQYYFGHKK